MIARSAALVLLLLSTSSLALSGVDARALRVGSGTVSDSLIERADSARTLGSSSATVWLIEAGDFECPACRAWHIESFPTIDRDYIRTGKIRFAFVNYPVAQHRNAVAAANAAMCAAVQNKFWPMHDSLYARQQTWTTQRDPGSAFRAIAKAVRVDMAAWNDCFGHGRIASLVDSDHDRLRDAGVHGTPSFFIGDHGLPGDPGLPALRALIDSVLAAK